MGWTALLCAVDSGHLDVVKRLLVCKQINVNLQSEVSRMLISSHRMSTSLPHFFLCVFLMNIYVDDKKNIRMDGPQWLWLQWMDIWMWSINCWTSNKLMLICRIKMLVECWFLHIACPCLFPISFGCVFFNENFVDGINKTQCRCLRGY